MLHALCGLLKLQSVGFRSLVAVVAVAGFGVMPAAADIFVENTGHTGPSRFAGVNSDGAPYGWVGQGGAHTWEVFRKNNATSVAGGNQISLVNSPSDPLQADFKGLYAYNNGNAPQFIGAGAMFGPDGNNMSDPIKITNASAVAGGAPAAIDLRIGFMETAGIGNFINNHHGDNRVGGPSANLPPAPTPSSDQTMDLYAGNWGVNGAYVRIQTNADGTLNHAYAYGMSANNTLPNEGANFAADPTTITYVPAGSGNVLGSPQPWQIGENISLNGSGHVVMRVNFGHWSLLWDLSQISGTTGFDSLTHDSFGTPYANGAFDWTHVTPVFFTAASVGTGEQALSLSYTSSPEPATLGLMGLGVVGLLARRRHAPTKRA